MNNKRSLLLALLVNVSFCMAQSEPDFSMIGFATFDGVGNALLVGGTVGGKGGVIVTPANFDELKRYVEHPSTPYIILLDKEFTTNDVAYINSATGHVCTKDDPNAEATTYGEVLKVGSNKSIIGVGDKAFLNRIGLNVQCQSNIIVRNVKFTLQGVPVDKSGENKIVALRNGVETLIGDPDCFSIQADNESLSKDQRISHHIWVDHCEFYNFPKSTEHKDRYDGLLDMKNDTRYVTISWCHFHDHSKACLFGKGDSDNFDRTTTLHHNFFENIKGSRLPLLRYGHHHYFNNYQIGCEDGLDARKNSNVYVENCYFENTKSPVHGKLSDNGHATVVDCIFKGCSNLPAGFTNIDGAKMQEAELNTPADFNPNETAAYMYDYSKVLDKAEDVPAIVSAYVGIGKIANEYDPTGVQKAVGIKEAISKEYYSVSGMKLLVPTKGITLVRVVYNDGSVKSVKEVR